MKLETHALGWLLSALRNDQRVEQRHIHEAELELHKIVEYTRSLETKLDQIRYTIGG